MNLKPNISDSFGCSVTGYLYDSDDPVDLGQTMVEVVTPTGILIDCGWMPDGDPDGCYVVTPSLGLRVIGQPYRTTDIRQAVEKIETWAKFYCGRPLIVESATTTNISAVLPPYDAAQNIGVPGVTFTAKVA